MGDDTNQQHTATVAEQADATETAAKQPVPLGASSRKMSAAASSAEAASAQISVTAASFKRTHPRCSHPEVLQAARQCPLLTLQGNHPHLVVHLRMSSCWCHV